MQDKADIFNDFAFGGNFFTGFGWKQHPHNRSFCKYRMTKKAKAGFDSNVRQKHFTQSIE